MAPSPLAPVKPIPAAKEKGPAQVNVPSLQAEPTTTTDKNTTCREQLTVNQLLTSPKEAYTSLKEEVGLFIIRQFLSQSQDGATILLKTGGQVIKYFFKLKIKTFIFKTKDKIIHFQPLELVKRSRARKTTDKVTRKTAIHRSKVVAETRTVVSGGAAGTQFKDELRTMGRLEREALLKEALGKEFKITIPRGDILAMKADLGETWYKVRKLRR